MSWQIDSAHSNVSFSVRHMMISTVRGVFNEFAGLVEFDEENPSRSAVDVTISAASLDTREAQRDSHLKSPDFFDVAQFPTLRFKSKRVEPISQERGKLVGDLTIKDVTREVELDVTYAGQAKSPWGATSAGFSASGDIDRREFGLTWNQALETGGILVGDKVKINIEAELVKQL